MATTVNLRDCKTAMMEAAKESLSDKDAQSFMDAIERKIENTDKTNLMTAEDQVNKIGGEFSAEVDKMALVNKRNSLFTISAVRTMNKVADTFKTPYEGLLAYLEDSRRNIQGAGRGVNAIIEGYKSKYLGELKARLMESNLMDDYLHDRLVKEVYQEFYNPGSSGSEKAKGIRDIMFAIKQDMVEKLNMYGSFINFLPEHVKRQTYSPTLIKKNFGPDRFKRTFNFKQDLTPAEYTSTFHAWREFIGPLLDSEKTFNDMDPIRFLKETFDGIMHNKYGPLDKADGAEINAMYFKAGSLAKRTSVERILHYKDGESAYAVYKAMSPEPLSHGFIKELEHGSTNIALMQQMGPNPSSALDTVIDQIEHRLSTQGREKELKELQDNKYKLTSALAYLDRSAMMPANPSMATATATAASLIAQSKLGRLLFFALPDRAFMQSTLTRNGLTNMDALATALKITKPSNEQDRLRLIMMGGELKSFVSTIHNRFTTGIEGTVASAVAKSQKFFFDFTGIHWFDDLGTDAVVGALPRHLGAMANKTYENIHPALQNMFQTFGITSDDWDKFRSTVYHTDSNGKPMEGFSSTNDNWITPDRFKDISGLSPKEADQLESKFRTWLSAQRDEAVLTPGSKEHRMATFGTQPGTPIGSMVRLLMMFKSFPLTVYTKIIKREMQGNGARTFLEWLASEKNTNFHATQLMAMGAVAGYLSLTIDDLIGGKMPRSFTNRQGDLDIPQSASILKEAFLRGGTGGIMADMLLREYDAGYKNILKAVGGPGANVAMQGTSLASKTITGQATGKNYLDFFRGNAPWINMFYIKPALDYMLMFNIQEMLDRGSIRDMELKHEDQYNQKYWLQPSHSLN